MTFEVGVGFNLESYREMAVRFSVNYFTTYIVIAPFMRNKAKPIVYKLQVTHNSVPCCHFNSKLRKHATWTASLRYTGV